MKFAILSGAGGWSLDLHGLVCREVVCGHVNLLAFGLVSHDVGQECHGLGRSVARCGAVSPNISLAWC